MDEKPVYRTGDTVGTIEQNNAVANSTPVQEPAAQPAVTPQVPMPDSPPQTPTDPASVATETSTPPEAPQPEENISTFKLPSFDDSEEVPEPAQAQQANPPVQSWKDAIKSVDKKEIFQELGLNDFVLELNDHIKNGGDAADYLHAKSVDYNKISDESLIKDGMKSQYPTFTPQEIERLFNKKYGISDTASEDEKLDAELQLKADGHILRQQKIQEQQKFKIAAPVQVNNEQERQTQEAAVARQIEAARQWYSEHDATKTLFQSKRVVLELGENGKFNFSVEQPELIMKAVTDGSFWQKITSTKQGEPDVAKMQKIALYALNPEQYENDLVNYGKSMKLRELTREGQNAQQPGRVLPIQPDNEKPTYKSGTVGGR